MLEKINWNEIIFLNIRNPLNKLDILNMQISKVKPCTVAEPSQTSVLLQHDKQQRISLVFCNASVALKKQTLFL